MARSVVFKTKGKLDLRSLTIFGLNAKPTTTTPIGYFGTGLKYAVAVLARERIPMTFWIDGKKWTVEQDDTKFRDKEFRSLTLKRHSLVPKTINLPFTTELGKNWELWQAFRELESNTRDEKGETFIYDSTFIEADKQKGYTYITAESEDFVQEYLDREKTFLPDGLTERGSTESVQCFLRKSNYLYYRSIRIMDLKEPSENTYNILSKVDLTEDRTVKNEILVKWELERYLANNAPMEVAKRAIVAPPKSYERTFDYSYTNKTEEFLDAIDEVKDEATPNLQAQYQAHRPPAPKPRGEDWIAELIEAMEDDDWRLAEEIIRDGHREEVLEWCKRAKAERDAQLPMGANEPAVPEASSSYGQPNWKKEPEDDNIPF